MISIIYKKYLLCYYLQTENLIGIPSLHLIKLLNFSAYTKVFLHRLCNVIEHISPRNRFLFSLIKSVWKIQSFSSLLSNEGTFKSLLISAKVNVSIMEHSLKFESFILVYRALPSCWNFKSYQESTFQASLKCFWGFFSKFNLKLRIISLNKNTKKRSKQNYKRFFSALESLWAFLEFKASLACKLKCFQA